MNKQRFADYLNKRLAVLNSAEREDIVNEYMQHINNKLAEGMSETEAVAALGDAEDLVRDILSAYNVDPDYDKGQEGIAAKIYGGVRHACGFVFGAFKHTDGGGARGDAAAFLRMLVRWCIRLFVICWMLPMLFALLCGIAAFGGLCVMLCMGYSFYGITIACLGFDIAGIAFAVLIFRILFIGRVSKI